ncbi:DUF2637 domain-containing protein [Streptomyces sp. H39-S7]|uniref:DUF2637 domain-containing protein n=1 Tax=Streptomyces sp. H39-S7 TaxID=3004357 RepID=UPI0022B022D3|nr:DUF2637 domain-containing protein [Streptomyces sp. H39-S7]MCZ4125763.1 DUF2637 domain-containing protein [Streptomyces sp. H39-S7]
MTAGKATPITLTRAHRILISVVVTGAVIIAGIGFAGSYAAVRHLAAEKGFGWFANVFPIGVDAGIVVLLALDLLLTWMRIPFPLLRPTAWLLTAATIAFNGAAAWPDPVGVGMHGIIPVLFVVSVEAGRHALGRIADLTADRHMESVRIMRWLLAPVPTFKLWRRMKLWELRSYDQVIRLEQDRLVYQARLQARYGRAWRRRAPIEAMMPLRLARFGVPLTETAAAGLAAAGIDAPAVLRPRQTAALELLESEESAAAGETQQDGEPQHAATPSGAVPVQEVRGHPGEPAAAPSTEELERADGWNESRGDAAVVVAQFQEQELRSAQPRYAGVPPARHTAPRASTVHSRVPDRPTEASTMGTSAATATRSAVATTEDREAFLLRGKAGVRAIFARMTPAERAESDNALAPRLAQQVGLSEGTTRKYLGAVRREFQPAD